MNLICWLAGHDWHRYFGTKRVACLRCHAAPYDDYTLHEAAHNFWRFALVPAITRIKTWVRSRPCWIKDHHWNAYSQFCQRCGQSGEEVAEQGEWTLPLWRKLWKPYLRDRFYVVKPYLKDQAIYAVNAGTWRFGLERSTIYIDGKQYMTRWIAYLGPLGLRLHKFYRGDDDRASHTHPWSFITFPFSSYHEELFNEGVSTGIRLVRAWRFHYRPADFEHVVIGSRRMFKGKPFWTFVITGPKNDTWGFYPEPGKFIPWQEYKA